MNHESRITNHECGVAVTGIGLVIPPGVGTARVTARALAGDSGIGPLRRLGDLGHACAAAGEVPPFDVGPSLRFPKNAKFMSRPVECAVLAASEALAQAGRLDEVDSRRLGIYTGSGQTGLETSEFFAAIELAEAGDEGRTYKHLGGRASRLVDRYWSLRTLSNAGLALLASELSARGPCNNFVQGDTASAQALGAAFFDLLEDRADVAVVGGYDCLLTPSTYLAYQRAGLLSSTTPARAHRPFDRERDGVALAEGAAFMVLERRAGAAARGATILAELLGVGFAQGIEDRPTPAIDAAAARLAIRDAAGDLQPDVVIAHGIGTRDDDAREAAMLASLGFERTPVTAMKGLTGYLGAATGIVELGIGILCARVRAVPPVTRFESADEGCPLDLVAAVPRRLDAELPMLLALSWSWSGQCSAVAARVIPATVP
jgi:3-oxoacyl-[acyl-carrier-protein] synthase II